MLRATLRSKSLAMSLLVHGSAVGAALVLAGAPPPPGGGRMIEFRLAALEAQRAPEFVDDPLPDEVDDQRPDEEVVVDDTVELPRALDVATEPPPLASELEPLPVLPAFEDPSAPFARLPHDLDLRSAPAPPAPTVPVVPAVAEVPPTRPQPPTSPTPTAVEPATPEPAPGPDSAVVASAPTPLAGATPMPDYPASWARRGWVGEVTIELDVAPDGSVSAARVVASSGFPRLDELARATLAKWRFAPAMASGAAVVGTFRKRVEFRAR